MFFNGSFRFIGKIDPEPIGAAVEAFGEEAWCEYLTRQQMYHMHRQTQSIPLLYDNDGRHVDGTPWPRFSALEPLMTPVFDTIREANRSVAGGREGYFIRIILTRLCPGSVITPHRDGGESLSRAHRYHVPIRTNPAVQFAIGREIRTLAAGEIWEINNRQMHAVSNPTDEPRDHLILDYVVPGERIADPDGLCIA
jgi:hypothetical protein